MGFRSTRHQPMGLENSRLISEISDRRKTENKGISTLGRNIGFSYLIQTKGKTSLIDDTGAIVPNKTGFKSVDPEREANWMVRKAFLKADGAALTRANTAYIYAFNHQNVGGFFDNGVGATALEAIESNTFFMSSFFTTYYTIANEPTLASTKVAYDSYASRVSAVMSWLETNKAVVYSVGSNTPNRLLFAALTFYLGGRLLNSSTYQNTAQQFIDFALAMIHEDGYFLEKGGWDSSYHGVSLLNLCLLFLHSTDTTFRSYIKGYISTTAIWLLSRILVTGEISAVGNTRTGLGQEEHSGKLKEINYGEVSLALFYSGFILGRNDLIKAGYNVQLYVYSRS